MERYITLCKLKYKQKDSLIQMTTKDSFSQNTVHDIVLHVGIVFFSMSKFLECVVHT